MNWPNSLIAEIAQRRCIVFLGAGASAGCRSETGNVPPDWKTFLEGLISLIPVTHSFAEQKQMITDLIAKDKYLEAAEVIHALVPVADYNNFIRNQLDQPRFQPSAIHEIVLELDPKIVVTTNYDRIYDNYCTNGASRDGYNVSRYYEDHLVSDLRSPIRTIIKAHGCVSNPAKIVLTKSQYFRAKKDYPNFFRILDALFLTNTLLFIGYSLNDPDIQLVLENATITAPTGNPHYFVVPNGTHEVIKNADKLSYNLDFIEFSPDDDYKELIEGLSDLKFKVLEARQTNPS